MSMSTSEDLWSDSVYRIVSDSKLETLNNQELTVGGDRRTTNAVEKSTEEEDEATPVSSLPPSFKVIRDAASLAKQKRRERVQAKSSSSGLHLGLLYSSVGC